MKTLDEVIIGIREQMGLGDPILIDALHYLKELRDMTDIPMEYFESGGTLQKLRNTSQFTCPKCHSEFVILDDPDGDHQQLEKCRALLQDFYRNDPLSWDELKGMEGKPVWVEADDGKYKRWFIVGNFFSWFEKEDFDAHVNLYYSCGAMEMSKETYGSYWQAYQKERKCQ